MADRPWLQKKEHRIASYVKGCRCDECRAANSLAGRTRRAVQRRARGRRDGDRACPLCGGWIHPKGMARHEASCEG